MELLVLWIAVGVVTGLAASARGRSFWGWLALGFLFSFFALIAVLVMDRVEQQATFHRPSGPTAMDRLEAAQGVHSLGQLAQERESRRAQSKRTGIDPGPTFYRGQEIRWFPDGYGVEDARFSTMENAERHIDYRLAKREPDGFVETRSGFDLYRRDGAIWLRNDSFLTLEAARERADALMHQATGAELYRDHAIMRGAEGFSALGRIFATATEARAAIDEKLRPVD